MSLATEKSEDFLFKEKLSYPDFNLHKLENLKYIRCNYEAVQESDECVCWNCCKRFSPEEIVKWKVEVDKGLTVLCPECELDSIVGNISIQYNDVDLNRWKNKHRSESGYGSYATHNYKQIKASTECGCVYCMERFDPSLVIEWIDRVIPTTKKEETNVFMYTAICPLCGIDTVIPNGSIKYTDDDLKRWHKEGFGN